MSLPILKSQWHSIAFRTIATILSIDVHSSYYPGHCLALILYSAALKNPLQGAKPKNIQLLKNKKTRFISHAYFLSVYCAHLYSSPIFTLGFPGGSVVKKKKKKIHLSMQEMQETWVQSLGQEDPLGEEMATHSSVLAWKIPWTEEPGGLQFMGSQRVGQDWVTEHIGTSSCCVYPHKWPMCLSFVLTAPFP